MIVKSSQIFMNFEEIYKNRIMMFRGKFLSIRFTCFCFHPKQAKRTVGMVKSCPPLRQFDTAKYQLKVYDLRLQLFYSFSHYSSSRSFGTKLFFVKTIKKRLTSQNNLKQNFVTNRKSDFTSTRLIPHV